MTPKMRQVIQQAGYQFCPNCWESGIEPAKPHQEVDGRRIGCGLTEPCSVCHGDGIVKDESNISGVPITSLAERNQRRDESCPSKPQDNQEREEG